MKHYRSAAIFLFVLVTFCIPSFAQLGLLRREDIQAGLSNPLKGITNPEAGDKEDEDCLARVKDMRSEQECDEAEIKRQALRMEKAWDALIHLQRPDMEQVDTNALFASQDLWKKYQKATCDFVGSLYYNADMGKHKNTCEWRMTRERADELEILLKNAPIESQIPRVPSSDPIQLPPSPRPR